MQKYILQPKITQWIEILNTRPHTSMSTLKFYMKGINIVV